MLEYVKTSLVMQMLWPPSAVRFPWQLRPMAAIDSDGIRQKSAADAIALSPAASGRNAPESETRPTYLSYLISDIPNSFLKSDTNRPRRDLKLNQQNPSASHPLTELQTVAIALRSQDRTLSPSQLIPTDGRER